MSEIKYATIPLMDIFSIGRGLPKYTRSYADKHKGKYPVYSSKTDDDGVFATIDTYDYDGKYLTWSTDGYAGIPAYRNGKFSCTDHCGILILNHGFNNVYLPYVRYQIDFRKLRLGYGNQRVKVNQVKNANLYIKIPLDKEGNFDVQMQMQLAEKYEAVEIQKQVLLMKMKTLKEISVLIPEDSKVKWAHPLVTELFYPKGGNSDFTKTWVSKNTGNIPLYSGTTTGEYARINKAEYAGEYLTWCIDGLAGYIMYHNEDFSLTCHRGVLLPTDKCVDIDFRYIKYVLEPIFRRRKKGREGDLGKNEYTSLKPIAIKRMKDTIPIPIKEDGTYDVLKQRELADKYEQIENIKESISQKILKLSEVVVV